MSRPQRENKVTLYFGVEGETEKKYLERLAKLLHQAGVRHIKFVITIAQTPKEYFKLLDRQNTDTQHVYHFLDHEGDPAHFKRHLDTISVCKKEYPSAKNYQLAYTNVTFEVWLLLHKTDPKNPAQLIKTATKEDKEKIYLPVINKLFKQSFEAMKTGKRDYDVLCEQITLDDVRNAIAGGKQLVAGKEPLTHPALPHGYHETNPSLNVHLVVQKILDLAKLQESATP